jgi:sulfur carrier protein
VRITVNGETKDITAGTTVSELIVSLGVERGRVAVEVNREIVPRSLHAEHEIAEGDRVEIVTMVGGG